MILNEHIHAALISPITFRELVDITTHKIIEPPIYDAMVMSEGWVIDGAVQDIVGYRSSIQAFPLPMTPRHFPDIKKAIS